MKVICVWCGKEIEERDSEGVGEITYSFCSECSPEIKALEEALSEYSGRPRKLVLLAD
jgi:DNA-directed RNA polymerase subunit RPC12/RpoP